MAWKTETISNFGCGLASQIYEHRQLAITYILLIVARSLLSLTCLINKLGLIR